MRALRATLLLHPIVLLDRDEAFVASAERIIHETLVLDETRAPVPGLGRQGLTILTQGLLLLAALILQLRRVVRDHVTGVNALPLVHTLICRGILDMRTVLLRA